MARRRLRPYTQQIDPRISAAANGTRGPSRTSSLQGTRQRVDHACNLWCCHGYRKTRGAAFSLNVLDHQPSGLHGKKRTGISHPESPSERPGGVSTGYVISKATGPPALLFLSRNVAHQLSSGKHAP